MSFAGTLTQRPPAELDGREALLTDRGDPLAHLAWVSGISIEA